MDTLSQLQHVIFSHREQAALSKTRIEELEAQLAAAQDALSRERQERATAQEAVIKMQREHESTVEQLQSSLAQALASHEEQVAAATAAQQQAEEEHKKVAAAAAAQFASVEKALRECLEHRQVLWLELTATRQHLQQWEEALRDMCKAVGFVQVQSELVAAAPSQQQRRRQPMAVQAIQQNKLVMDNAAQQLPQQQRAVLHPTVVKVASSGEKVAPTSALHQQQQRSARQLVLPQQQQPQRHQLALVSQQQQLSLLSVLPPASNTLAGSRPQGREQTGEHAAANHHGTKRRGSSQEHELPEPKQAHVQTQLAAAQGSIGAGHRMLAEIQQRGLVRSGSHRSDTLADEDPVVWLNRNVKNYVNSLRKEKQFEIFKDPVPGTTPGYYEVIKRPMDLGTIANKAADEEYGTPEEFKAQLQLVVENAKTFNPKGHPYHTLAEQLWDWINKKNSFFSRVDGEWVQRKMAF